MKLLINFISINFNIYGIAFTEHTVTGINTLREEIIAELKMRN